MAKIMIVYKLELRFVSESFSEELFLLFCLAKGQKPLIGGLQPNPYMKLILIYIFYC